MKIQVNIKKMVRSIFCAVYLLMLLGQPFVRQCFAESDTILDDESDQQTTAEQGNESSGSGETTKSKSVQLSDLPTEALIQKRGKIQLSLMGGAHYNSYKLEGTGFTAELPLELGYQYGAGVRYRTETGRTAYGITFANLNTKNAGLVGLTPAQIETSRRFLSVDFTMYPSVSNEDFGLVMGYSIRERASTVTNPNRAVSGFSARGPFVGVTQTLNLSERWYLDLGAVWSFLNFYDEIGTRTGYRRSANHFSLSSNLFYSLSQSTALGVGVQGGLTAAEFDGSGTRGVTGAAERDWTLEMPVEFRMYF